MANDKRKESEERYKKAIEPNSMQRILDEKKKIRDNTLEQRRVYAEDYEVFIQSLVNTMIMEFNEMFPGAEAFIEGRIKSKNSIVLKLKNKFEKAMDETTLEKRIKAIEKVDLTDILAFSVVVTTPPKRFTTTDDKLNERLNEMAKGFEISGERVKEHKRYIEDSEEQLERINADISELKQERTSISKKGPSPKMKEMFEDCISFDDDTTKKLYEKLALLELDELQKEINVANTQKVGTEESIKYAQKNLTRTLETYYKELLEIQREMAYYFVSNLAKCQSFRILNTTQTEAPETKNKPGFVATSAKYVSVYTDSETGQTCEIAYEIQGKGEEDWKIAEFGKGASYHENQKSNEGQYSKQTHLPDFTIIGKNDTEEIEYDVRSEYIRLNFEELLKKSKVDFPQWFKEHSNLNAELIMAELEKLRKYIKRIQDRQEKPIIITDDEQKKLVEKDTDEYERYKDIIEKVAETKISEAFEAAKEHIIQNEIERRINLKIDKKADEKTFIRKLEKNEKDPLNSIYNREIDRLRAFYESKADESKTDEDIKHEARVRVLYYIKEEEIREIAKDVVPISFSANISDDINENPIVYYRSLGEAIYRYYYNRLHGLKKGNGYEENIEPQEQQKRALLKLTGLFEGDERNFFIYDKEKNSRVDLSEAIHKTEGEER